MRLANRVGVLAFMVGLALAGCSQTYVDDSMNRGGGNGGDATYPAGPYGYAVGSTISNINLVGKMDPNGPNGTADYSAMPMQQIKLGDYYNKQYKLIVLGGVAGWCKYCNEEQPEMNRMYAQYNPQGVQFILGLAQSFATKTSDIGPATEDDLNRWARIHSTRMPIGLDPNEQLQQFAPDIGSWPLTIIIDASNMQIIDFFTGAQTAKLERIIKNFLAQ